MQSRVLAILIAVVLALVATAALVVYVNGRDRRAIADQSPVLVYVAKARIKAATSGEDALNAMALTRIAMPRKSVADGVIRSPDQLKNRFAAVDIVEGEQLLLDRWVGAEDIAGRRLLPIPEGHQALSIGLDLQRQVAGFVTPGDRVSTNCITRGLVTQHPSSELPEHNLLSVNRLEAVRLGTESSVDPRSNQTLRALRQVP